MQYLLFKAVGLEDLANDKGERLGIGHNWQNATVTDANGQERGVEVLTSKNGRVLQGNFAGTEERLNKQQLSEAASSILGKGVHVTKASTMIDPTTKQLVMHQTLSNGQERYTSGGKSYTGDRTKLVPEAEHTKQEDRRVNAGYAKLKAVTDNPTDQQKYQFLREQGVPPTRIEQELGLTPGSLSKVVPSTGAAVGQAPAGQAPAAQAAPGTRPAMAATPGIGARPDQAPGELNKDYQARLDVWKKKQDRIEKRAEELPKIESNAAESIATVADLLTHPGFSDVIGVPNVITGIFSPPGTDARDFKSKYKQLLGEQFLAGFNSLRGGGSITEVEGQQAKEAVAAMQDPYISEAEFKRNAALYVNTMKRAVNRERAIAGLAPKYPDVPEAGQTAPASGIKIIKRERVQ